MTKTACIFPGQGSQAVGMGKLFHDNFPVAREVFQEVDDALGLALSKIMFEGPEATLTETANAQPAIMATSIAILRVMEKEAGFSIKNSALVAGHSLGEYSALCAAGAFSLAATAALLRLRGEAMQRAVPLGEGGMSAILGLDLPAVELVVDEAGQGEVCEVANDNAPGQIVISGNTAVAEYAVAIHIDPEPGSDAAATATSPSKKARCSSSRKKARGASTRSRCGPSSSALRASCGGCPCPSSR